MRTMRSLLFYYYTVILFSSSSTPSSPHTTPIIQPATALVVPYQQRSRIRQRPEHASTAPPFSERGRIRQRSSSTALSFSAAGSSYYDPLWGSSSDNNNNEVFGMDENIVTLLRVMVGALTLAAPFAAFTLASADVAASSSVIQSALVAYGHYLGMVSAVGILIYERFAIENPFKSKQTEDELSFADQLFGLSVMTVASTGFLKVTQYGQGWDYYSDQPLFWAKLLLFAIFASSNLFTTTIFTKRSLSRFFQQSRGDYSSSLARFLQSNDSLRPIGEQLTNRLTQTSNIQLASLILFPLISSAIAKGERVDMNLPWEVEATFDAMVFLGFGLQNILAALDFEEQGNGYFEQSRTIRSAAAPREAYYDNGMSVTSDSFQAYQGDADGSRGLPQPRVNNINSSSNKNPFARTPQGPTQGLGINNTNNNNIGSKQSSSGDSQVSELFKNLMTVEDGIGAPRAPPSPIIPKQTTTRADQPSQASFFRGNSDEGIDNNNAGTSSSSGFSTPQNSTDAPPNRPMVTNGSNNDVARATNGGQSKKPQFFQKLLSKNKDKKEEATATSPSLSTPVNKKTNSNFFGGGGRNITTTATSVQLNRPEMNKPLGGVNPFSSGNKPMGQPEGGETNNNNAGSTPNTTPGSPSMRPPKQNVQANSMSQSPMQYENNNENGNALSGGVRTNNNMKPAGIGMPQGGGGPPFGGGGPNAGIGMPQGGGGPPFGGSGPNSGIGMPQGGGGPPPGGGGPNSGIGMPQGGGGPPSGGGGANGGIGMPQGEGVPLSGGDGPNGGIGMPQGGGGAPSGGGGPNGFGPANGGGIPKPQGMAANPFSGPGGGGGAGGPNGDDDDDNNNEGKNGLNSKPATGTNPFQGGGPSGFGPGNGASGTNSPFGGGSGPTPGFGPGNGGGIPKPQGNPFSGSPAGGIGLGGPNGSNGNNEGTNGAGSPFQGSGAPGFGPGNPAGGTKSPFGGGGPTPGGGIPKPQGNPFSNNSPGGGIAGGQNGDSGNSGGTNGLNSKPMPGAPPFQSGPGNAATGTQSPFGGGGPSPGFGPGNPAAGANPASPFGGSATNTQAGNPMAMSAPGGGSNSPFDNNGDKNSTNFGQFKPAPGTGFFPPPGGGYPAGSGPGNPAQGASPFGGGGPNPQAGSGNPFSPGSAGNQSPPDNTGNMGGPNLANPPGQDNQKRSNAFEVPTSLYSKDVYGGDETPKNFAGNNSGMGAPKIRRPQDKTWTENKPLGFPGNSDPRAPEPVVRRPQDKRVTNASAPGQVKGDFAPRQPEQNAGFPTSKGMAGGPKSGQFGGDSSRPGPVVRRPEDGIPRQAATKNPMDAFKGLMSVDGPGSTEDFRQRHPTKADGDQAGPLEVTDNYPPVNAMPTKRPPAGFKKFDGRGDDLMSVSDDPPFSEGQTQATPRQPPPMNSKPKAPVQFNTGSDNIVAVDEEPFLGSTNVQMPTQPAPKKQPPKGFQRFDGKTGLMSVTDETLPYQPVKPDTSAVSGPQMPGYVPQSLRGELGGGAGKSESVQCNGLMTVSEGPEAPLPYEKIIEAQQQNMPRTPMPPPQPVIPIQPREVPVQPVQSVRRETADANEELVFRVLYSEWCQQYGKQFDEARLAIFSSNMKKVEEYSQRTGKTLKLIEYADLTKEEYQARVKADTRYSPGPAMTESDAVPMIYQDDKKGFIQQVSKLTADSINITPTASYVPPAADLFIKPDSPLQDNTVAKDETIDVLPMVPEPNLSPKAPVYDNNYEEVVDLSYFPPELEIEEQALIPGLPAQSLNDDTIFSTNIYDGRAKGDFEMNSSEEKIFRILYLEWCQQYEKVFDESKLGVFASNMKQVEQYNEDTGMIPRLIEFADLTKEEYEARLNYDAITKRAAARETASASSRKNDFKLTKSEEKIFRILYSEWCQQYDKEFEEEKLEIFAANMKKVEKYNEETGKVLRLIEFADLTQEEYEARLSYDAITKRAAARGVIVEPTTPTQKQKRAKERGQTSRGGSSSSSGNSSDRRTSIAGVNVSPAARYRSSAGVSKKRQVPRPLFDERKPDPKPSPSGRSILDAAMSTAKFTAAMRIRKQNQLPETKQDGSQYAPMSPASKGKGDATSSVGIGRADSTPPLAEPNESVPSASETPNLAMGASFGGVGARMNPPFGQANGPKMPFPPKGEGGPIGTTPPKAGPKFGVPKTQFSSQPPKFGMGAKGSSGMASPFKPSSGPKMPFPPKSNEGTVGTDGDGEQPPTGSNNNLPSTSSSETPKFAGGATVTGIGGASGLPTPIGATNGPGGQFPPPNGEREIQPPSDETVDAVPVKQESVQMMEDSSKFNETATRLDSPPATVERIGGPGTMKPPFGQANGPPKVGPSNPATGIGAPGAMNLPFTPNSGPKTPFPPKREEESLGAKGTPATGVGAPVSMKPPFGPNSGQKTPFPPKRDEESVGGRGTSATGIGAPGAMKPPFGPNSGPKASFPPKRDEDSIGVDDNGDTPPISGPPKIGLPKTALSSQPQKVGPGTPATGIGAPSAMKAPFGPASGQKTPFPPKRDEDSGGGPGTASGGIGAPGAMKPPFGPNSGPKTSFPPKRDEDNVDVDDDGKTSPTSGPPQIGLPKTPFFSQPQKVGPGAVAKGIGAPGAMKPPFGPTSGQTTPFPPKRDEQSVGVPGTAATGIGAPGAMKPPFGPKSGSKTSFPPKPDEDSVGVEDDTKTPPVTGPQIGLPKTPLSSQPPNVGPGAAATGIGPPGAMKPPFGPTSAQRTPFPERDDGSVGVNDDGKTPPQAGPKIGLPKTSLSSQPPKVGPGTPPTAIGAPGATKTPFGPRSGPKTPLPPKSDGIDEKAPLQAEPGKGVPNAPFSKPPKFAGGATVTGIGGAGGIPTPIGRATGPNNIFPPPNGRKAQPTPDETVDEVPEAPKPTEMEDSISSFNATTRTTFDSTTSEAGGIAASPAERHPTEAITNTTSTDDIGNSNVQDAESDDAVPERVLETYKCWCEHFGKEFNAYRLRIFQANFLMLEDYFDKTGIAVDMNEFSDLTPEEYQERQQAQ